MDGQPNTTKERATFEKALKSESCPKCGGRVREMSMPDVACEKCGARYTLTTRIGWDWFGLGSGPRHRLIERTTT